MSEPRNPLKRKLMHGQPAFGLWVTLEAPSIAEIAAYLGLDWIVIDAEHGHLDWKEIVEHLRAVRGTRTAALVRIEQIDAGRIKRVLDLGADGILVPQVRCAEEIRRAVEFAKYPPWGTRGLGAERATRWGVELADYARRANDETLVIPMLEHVECAESLDEIVAIEGIDAFYFGPADFSASCGQLGGWDPPGVAERLAQAKDRLREANIPCGILGRDLADAQRRLAEGFQMIGLGSDTGMLIRGIRDMLAGCTR